MRKIYIAFILVCLLMFAACTNSDAENNGDNSDNNSAENVFANDGNGYTNGENSGSIVPPVGGVELPYEGDEPNTNGQAIDSGFDGLVGGAAILFDGVIFRTGQDEPVSRALAAKMLTTAFLARATIDTMPEYLPFTDVSENAWYRRYINAAFNEGLMVGYGETFAPHENITLEQAQIILDRLNPDSSSEMQLTDENRNLPVTYELWLNLFLVMLDELSDERTIMQEFGMGAVDVVVMITPGTFPALNAFNIITDVGPFGTAGFVMENYIDRAVRVLTKEGNVVAVLGVTSETPTIHNALVRSRTAEYITIFSGGAERTYRYSGENNHGIVANVTISGNDAVRVEEFSQTVRCTVLRVSAEWQYLYRFGFVEFETPQFYSHRILEFCENFKVYGMTGANPAWRNRSHLIVGTDIAEFIVHNGIVLAAVIDRTAQPENLRVAVSVGLTAAGDNSGGFVHSSVSVTSDVPFTVTGYRGEVLTFAAGEVFTPGSYPHGNRFGHFRARVMPLYEHGRIQVLSTTRHGGENPWYRGVIEIANEPNGFTIINEICMEEYLYAVLPSEMPTGFGVEALKVQAVTARSFAFNQFFTNRLARFGGQICDTTASQVYNNIPENEVSITATRETNGMVLRHGNRVISANFFSTSAGVTANSGEVWAAGRRIFPTTTPQYLSSVRQYREGDFGDLRVEENARRFFMDTTVESFDSEFSWFRWNVTYTAAELAASINANLITRYNANPNMITTLVGDVFRSVPTETIGELLDIEVIERGEGGNIKRLLITGTEATIIVATEFNIRFLMPPAQAIPGAPPIVLNLHNGTVSNNRALLPSAFFVIEQNRDANGVLLYVTLYGGGNGHGVGMSQNGVMGMINAGYNYRQILEHFYPGTMVDRI